jgi:threonine synthase
MIVATNTNLVLSQALETGIFAKIDIKNTLASAIDISVPMNFWRHLYFSLDGDADRIREAWELYDSEGTARFSAAEHAAFSNGFRAYTVSDEMILATTRSLWQQENYLLDPHGAVAVAAARHYRSQISGTIVCLATAHPAKFPETIRLAIGKLPAQGSHGSLEAARSAGERKYTFDHANMQQAVPEVMRTVMTNQR